MRDKIVRCHVFWHSWIFVWIWGLYSWYATTISYFKRYSSS